MKLSQYMLKHLQEMEKKGSDASDKLAMMLTVLSPRQEQTIRFLLGFGEPRKSFEEIAGVYNMPVGNMRQIAAGGIGKLVALYLEEEKSFTEGLRTILALMEAFEKEQEQPRE
mgnify:CR=1 FL=1